MDTCTHPDCINPVSQTGYKLCLEHWKSSHTTIPITSQEKIKPSDSTAITTLMSATTLGEHLELSNQKINQVLAELGWMNKGAKEKGWITTPQGISLGAIQKESHQTGIPFVMWPESILQNNSLVSTVKSLKGEMVETITQTIKKEDVGFRERYPAAHRTTDGHLVRSRAEMLIDNWLYMSGIVHAYERQLPIEEELYCDFYVPAGKVYIEYWGLESDPKYQARKKIKIDLYRKYNFNLIELTDEHIKNLDDFLPKMLLKFKVIVS